MEYKTVWLPSEIYVDLSL